MGTWKKAENEKGFIYYISDQQNLQQWDHPKFCDVKQAIDDCNYVIYATYRLALKFRVLQRALYTEDIPLALTSSIFERHRLANNENSLILETCDLEAVLADIFFAANNQNHMNIDVDFVAEMVINFLYNVFDSCREGTIQVISVKLTLGLLCNSSLPELHKYIFSLCADHNNCITRVRLLGLLQKMHLLIKYLHEDPVFNVHCLNAAVDKCFVDSPGLVGIAECTFMSWLNSDIPFLSWLPLVAKLKNSETVIHPLKCSTCKTTPLLGLRYSCAKCPKYLQCQRCFLTGRTSHSHKASHSLREYCTVLSKKDACRMVFHGLYGWLFCAKKPNSFYSAVKPSRHFANGGCKLMSAAQLCDIDPLSSPETQLQGVIRQLESQNRELQQMLIFGHHNDKEMRKYLEEYRLFMAGNIQKLKMLKMQINTSGSATKENRCNLGKTQSTPMVCQHNASKYKLGSLENVSPITLMTEIEDSLASGSDTQCQTPLELPYFAEPKAHFDVPKLPRKLSHHNLDEALARLQQILANNFSLDDSLSQLDNSNLQYAVTEVEGMLTSIIDNVESSRCNSALKRLKS
ncbi:dystrophin isoform X1 [Dendroctonus ponderosae]|uniref:dystrophin isoform X1 n=1 Tax=Dendroctonus ponderosae TaxID=77166 RepID=UPI0020362A1F|nr:dystrophin isoform X1 [Dendroctonus ponderosae]XP_048523452.1 dystrophin isoform X1 [Dendroctonus ponderosae]